MSLALPASPAPLVSPALLFLLVTASGLGCSGAGAAKATPAVAPLEVAPIVAQSKAPLPPPAASATSTESTLPKADPGFLLPWSSPYVEEDPVACKAILKAQESASKRHAKMPRNGIAKDAPPVELEVFGCIPATGGAWGLIATYRSYPRNAYDEAARPECGEDKDGSPCVYDAIVTLVPTFATSSGAVRKGKSFEAVARGQGLGPPGFHGVETGAFDLDGDGVEELLFAYEGSAIFSTTGGQVVPYPPAEKLKFAGLADIDQDGRPDLVMQTPYSVEADSINCGERSGYGINDFAVGVHVVARSLPDGTFSLTDAVAQAATKQVCPAVPAPIVVKDDKGNFDNRKIRTNVACARLWGVPEATVKSALDTDCKWPGSFSANCDALFDVRDKNPIQLCAGRDWLSLWAKAPPPTTLH